MSRGLRRLILVFVLATSYAGEAFSDNYNASDLAQCAQVQSRSIDQEAILFAESTLSQASAKYLPSASVAARASKLTDPTGPSSSDSVTLSLDQKIISTAVWAEVDADRAGVRSAKSDAAQRALDLSVAALSDIVNIQTLREQKALLEARLESYQTLARILSASQRVGLSDSNDYLQALSSALGNESDLKRVDFNIQKAHSDFLAKYGYSAQPLDRFKELPTSDELRFDELPESRSLRHQIDQITLQKNQLERSYWPEFSLQGTYGATRYNGQTLGTSPALQGTLLLNLDFSGLWGTKGQRTAYASVKNQRESVLRQRIVILKNNYRQVDQELALIATQIPLLKQRGETAARAKELLKIKMRLGRLGFLELQQTEDGAFSAGQDYSAALYRQQQLQLQKNLASYFSDTTATRPVSCRLKAAP